MGSVSLLSLSRYQAGPPRPPPHQAQVDWLGYVKRRTGSISHTLSQRLPHCLNCPITSPTRVWLGVAAGRVSQELGNGHP